MKHVLGMAKRHLDLRGAKAEKVELDYLRLAFAVRELRRSGEHAMGYLLVMTPAIGKRAAGWGAKYQTHTEVEVLVAGLTVNQHRELTREARSNRSGMVAGTRGRAVRGRSDARQGGRLAEVLLRRLIKKRENRVRCIQNKAQFPFAIQWDYYGVAAGH